MFTTTNTTTTMRKDRVDRTDDLLPWLAALHLASPALPVGGFSYSQGLEAAFALGLLGNAEQVRDWIEAAQGTSLERCEAPVWTLHHRAWRERDFKAARSWNTWFLETRESAELRRETEQMGWSMVRLVESLELGEADARMVLSGMQPVSYPAASAFAYAARDVPEEIGLAAYCFCWLENQVAAALKTISLGQVAGQKILLELALKLPGTVHKACLRADQGEAGIDTLAPQLAILSGRHETQYSRLFRS